MIDPADRGKTTCSATAPVGPRCLPGGRHPDGKAIEVGEHLGEQDRAQLLALAECAVWRAAAGKPHPPTETDRPALLVHRGAFVTLRTPRGELRGCIGIPRPIKPLWHAVREAAQSACCRDPRFPPVTPDELPGMSLEISALTVFEPIAGAGEVRVGLDGLHVSGLGHAGLLLPQVAEERRWNAEEFLRATCAKAGLNPGDWQDPRLSFQRFQAEVFGETINDHGGSD